MSKLPFTKKNYWMMIAGLFVIILGFGFMASDSEPYGFGFVGITLSPVTIVSGFIIELFAILYRPREKQ